MQAVNSFSHRSGSVNWIATIGTYAVALAAVAALAFLGVDETRGLLLG